MVEVDDDVDNDGGNDDGDDDVDNLLLLFLLPSRSDEKGGEDDGDNEVELDVPHLLDLALALISALRRIDSRSSCFVPVVNWTFRGVVVQPESE